MAARHNPPATIPVEKRIPAVEAWFRLGSMKEAAKEIGVSIDIVKAWRVQPWWDQEVQRLQQMQREELDVQLSDILARSLDIIRDRLENGEEKVTKDGSVVRVGVSVRDAAVVTGIVFDKRQVLRGQPNSITRDDDKLHQLAEKLRAFAGHKVIDQVPEVIPAGESGSPA